MLDYFPLLTTVVAFIFTILLTRQFVQRRKTHQIVWTVAMLLYALSALMEFLMNKDLYGADASAAVTIFRVYYIMAAPLVGLLGAGVVYLLVRRSIANYFLGFIVILSIALAIAGLVVPIDETVILNSFSGDLAAGFRSATAAYPITVRIFAIILNSIGGLILILGPIYSLIRDRSRLYNIPLFIGGLLPSIGGSLIGLGNPDVFFQFELGGTIFLFIGFLWSDIWIRRPQTTPTSPQKPSN